MLFFQKKNATLETKGGGHRETDSALGPHRENQRQCFVPTESREQCSLVDVRHTDRDVLDTDVIAFGDHVGGAPNDRVDRPLFYLPSEHPLIADEDHELIRLETDPQRHELSQPEISIHDVGSELIVPHHVPSKHVVRHFTRMKTESLMHGLFIQSTHTPSSCGFCVAERTLFCSFCQQKRPVVYDTGLMRNIVYHRLHPPRIFFFHFFHTE